MNKALTFMALAFAFAFAAVPTTSVAQDRRPAYFGAIGYEKKQRVTVAQVRPGSTADLIGLRPDDVIVEAGGKKITTEGKIKAFIRALRVGDGVELTVRRKGKLVQLKGTAIALPTSAAI